MKRALLDHSDEVETHWKPHWYAAAFYSIHALRRCILQEIAVGIAMASYITLDETAS